MANKSTTPIRIASISELHRILQLHKPRHPLISLVDNTEIAVDMAHLDRSFILEFYKISYKNAANGKIGYGQGYYDFSEGGMIFTAPNQVLLTDNDTQYTGCTLLIHPDFIRNYPLGKTIKKYGFFSYETNEALHLSEKEKSVMMTLFNSINQELDTAIDEISQDVLIAYLEVLLNYSNRFYKRQFVTRKSVNHSLLNQMEELLNAYFDQDESLRGGLPTVEFIASRLNLSPRYLSDMLRSLTGLNAQQHIHEKLIEKAKEYLSASNLSIAEIAYQLGFEHPQSFSKLFKHKVEVSPVNYRQSFN